MEIKTIKAWRKRLNEIIEVAAPEDKASRAYDLLNMLTIVVNLIISLAYTFETIRKTTLSCSTARSTSIIRIPFTFDQIQKRTLEGSLFACLRFEGRRLHPDTRSARRRGTRGLQGAEGC